MKHWLWLAAGCIVLAVVYSQGVHGPFLVDDFAAIVDNPAIRLQSLDAVELTQAALSSSAGPLGRPLAMMSFAINHALGGMAPAAFKATNILLHLLITALVYGVARSLLDRRGPLPLFVALLWALHPQQVSTVLYAVQRMSQLAMLCVMAAVWVYVAARQRQLGGDVRGGWLRMGLALPLLFAGALFSKENGVLLPVFLLAIELTFFRFASAGPRFVLPTLLVLPTLAIFIALLTVAPGLPSTRDFTTTERLLTEARLLWVYLGQWCWPDIRNMPFYYDHFPIARGWSDAWPAVAAWGLVAAALAVGIWKKRCPVCVFAGLWFLGGHLLESTTLPLEIGFEHRNYLPSFGLAFFAGWGLWQLRGAALPAMACLVLLWPLNARIGAWSSEEAFFAHAVAIAPASARAWGDYSYFLAQQGRPGEALDALRRAAELNPREAGYPLAAIHLQLNRLGAAPDAAIVAEAERRLSAQPLTAYGHTVLHLLLTPLLDLPPDAQRFAVMRCLLAAVESNPSLRPKSRPIVALALAYLRREEIEPSAQRRHLEERQ